MNVSGTSDQGQPFNSGDEYRPVDGSFISWRGETLAITDDVLAWSIHRDCDVSSPPSRERRAREQMIGQ